MATELTLDLFLNRRVEFPGLITVGGWSGYYGHPDGLTSYVTEDGYGRQLLLIFGERVEARFYDSTWEIKFVCERVDTVEQVERIVELFGFTDEHLRDYVIKRGKTVELTDTEKERFKQWIIENVNANVVPGDEGSDPGLIYNLVHLLMDGPNYISWWNYQPEQIEETKQWGVY